jgi:GNAT superfamily N-acetyltransferase
MGIHIRAMTPTDIPAGMRLKDLAGWNQTAEDWARFLETDPQGCFVAECQGQVVGTATTIIYEGRLAWVGMVLVDPDFRGKGIGTAVLESAIAYLDGQRVPCIKLDATPQGKPLYERLGFRAEYEIERCLLRRTGGRIGGDASQAPCQGENLTAALAIDRDVFGANRSAVLRSIARAAPELVALAQDDSGLQGYALGRKGSHADHLGPWVARNARAAQDLLDRFLERTLRDVIVVDILTDNPWARALAANKGFEFSRTLTRMYRGTNEHPGLPEIVCAILGPELG